MALEVGVGVVVSVALAVGVADGLAEPAPPDVQVSEFPSADRVHTIFEPLVALEVRDGDGDGDGEAPGVRVTGPVIVRNGTSTRPRTVGRTT